MHLLVWNSIYIQFSAIRFRTSQKCFSSQGRKKREEIIKLILGLNEKKIKGRLNTSQKKTKRDTFQGKKGGYHASKCKLNKEKDKFIDLPYG